MHCVHPMRSAFITGTFSMLVPSKGNIYFLLTQRVKQMAELQRYWFILVPFPKPPNLGLSSQTMFDPGDGWRSESDMATSEIKALFCNQVAQSLEEILKKASGRMARWKCMKCLIRGGIYFVFFFFFGPLVPWSSGPLVLWSPGPLTPNASGGEALRPPPQPPSSFFIFLSLPPLTATLLSKTT